VTRRRWARRVTAALAVGAGIAAPAPAEPATDWPGAFDSLLRSAGAALLDRVYPLVRVRGSVRLSSGPLRARLAFIDEAGLATVVTDSDEDGRFEARLPAVRTTAGWTIEVSAAAPPVSRLVENVAIRLRRGETEAFLELVLPGPAVRGIVIAEDGEPQSSAQVLAEDLAGGQRHAATADERGRFEMFGLTAGTYRVTAEGTHGYSEPLEVAIEEGAEPEIRLVLARRKRLLAGRVLRGDEPVAGATLHVWLPPGRPAGSFSADDRGRFELPIPADAVAVGLTVSAAGHALKVTRVAASGSRPITLGLEPIGGTLVLDAGEAAGPFSPILSHGGSLESVETLADWSLLTGGHSDGTRWVIPAVEPGAYRLCTITPHEAADLWEGRNPAHACADGTLAPGGTLTLSAPRR
jgi:hypothetical protein